MTIEEAIRRAIKNIAKYGDTDIFPYLIEKNVFYDKESECCGLIKEIHDNFRNYISSHPPATIDTLTQVGYTGFRWATQIEPFWNAYYLALVIKLAEIIEEVRVPETEKIVFSYRFCWDEKEAKLFKDSTWSHYKKECLERTKDFKYVIETDISDFYPRIYHHRIQNALSRLNNCEDIPDRIMDLLQNFSKNVSYGLPIGGPASRILAELALNGVDKLLLRQKVIFCRYADDYTIFCNDKSDAYKTLVKLSEKLYNEGLILQKKKTKILQVKEYYESSTILVKKFLEKEEENLSPESKLLNIAIRFDPYSETAVEDYDKLKKSVQQIDIIGILGREINKTLIDTTVTKQAINAIKALGKKAQEGAILTILDSQNIDVLAPVFVTIMRAIKGVYEELNDNIKETVDQKLIELFDKNSHLLSVDLNMSYFIQALSKSYSQRKEEILIEIYDNNPSSLIRRQIILMY